MAGGSPLRAGAPLDYFFLSRSDTRPREVSLLSRRRRSLSHRRHAVAAPLPLLLAAAVACGRIGGGDADAEDGAASAAPNYVTSAAAPAPIAATRYAAARRLDQVGSVRGAVEIVGEVPPDTVVRPISDQEVCGDSVIDVSVEHDGNRLAGAVVWINGVKAGKRLPLTRRYELGIEQCRMMPRTLAAIAGGALNVHNDDRAQHRTRFLRQGTRDPVATVPYSDDGQVVPVTAALSRPGLVEARCDVHPWGRAWIAVFDQPYFAVTAADGSFAMDSVPPGKYTLVAWHPRLGLVRDTVRVVAGREQNVVLRLEGKR